MKRFLVAAFAAGWLTAVAAQPGTSSATQKPWVGRAAAIESHLKTAEVVRLEDIGTGVTHPRRAHLSTAEPFESFAWKVLPPGKRNGYWESYKSEIAAYELDKLLGMDMVPPAVERRLGDETGAAVMWVGGMKSVKQLGGKVPSGPLWGKPLRRMLTFDNLIANIDRNAGNMLIGAEGELILIDHSRCFTETSNLVNKVERVDADVWTRAQSLTRDDLTRALGAWIDAPAIDAILDRRQRMAKEIDKLVAKKGRSLVIVP